MEKRKRRLDIVIYTAIAVLLLCAVMWIIINHVYESSERAAYEKLHLETMQIKSDINQQMESDMETLITMADFASRLYHQGENFDLVFRSFRENGLFEKIGILMPDDSFIIEYGKLDIGDKLSFEEESKKGRYISGRVKDLTDDEVDIVRCNIPIRAENGDIVAILCGVINLKTFENRYVNKLNAMNADLFVLEGENGNFLIDTKRDTLSNITELAGATFNDDFSYEKMVEDITEGKSGYSSFQSMFSEEYLYAHYEKLDFSDWRIILMKPQTLFFAEASSTGRYMAYMAGLIILITLAYMGLMIMSERSSSKISKTASAIRKRLLEVNADFDKIYDALKKLTTFARARSAFFVDTYGEEYCYINPHMANWLLEGDDRKYFIEALSLYMAKRRGIYESDLSFIKVSLNGELLEESPEFYDFLVKNEIKSVCFAAVVKSNSNISLLGVINPEERQTENIIKDIAICFSMAVYNKKHLISTEEMALTDALTGIANRMAYKNDVKQMKRKMPKNLACIYIDVNELSYYNNQYGHAAGDQMLVFVSGVLKNEFPDSRFYRMGGDEFLIFAENLSGNVIRERLKSADAKIKEMKYHISVGIKTKEYESDVEELVNNAEMLMYKEKARYYQNKNLEKMDEVSTRKINAMATGIKELDACLAIMSTHYHGAYSVSLRDDTAMQIIAPSTYFNISDKEQKFSEVMRQYVHDLVNPEYHRTLLNFLQYDVLERQLRSGHNPNLSYAKIDGEKIILTIYPFNHRETGLMDTLWIFEKDE